MKKILLTLTGLVIMFAPKEITAQNGDSTGAAPNAIAGDAILVDIDSGSPPVLADYGYFLLLPANSGNSCRIVNIVGTVDDTGAYSYKKTSANMGQIALHLTKENVSCQIGFKFYSENNGDYSLATTSPSGYYQYGRFGIATNPVLSSIAGKSFFFMADDGNEFFGDSESYAISFGASGKTYTVSNGDSLVIGSGTCSYSVINKACGAIQLKGVAGGLMTVYVAFIDGSSTGNFVITQPTSGGFQKGSFSVADGTPPTISITTPAKGQSCIDPTLSVTGKASDDGEVAAVYCQLGESDWKLADTSNGWRNWSCALTLTTLSNTVRAYAVDEAGNVSSTNSVSFNYTPALTICVLTNGQGSVTPNLNGKAITAGKICTLTAKQASASYLFSGWTGSIVTNAATITFTAQTNMILQANFIPNPFIAIAGTYQGLFFDPANVTPDRAGMVVVTPLSSGAYSARLTLGSKTCSLSGKLPVTGFASTNAVLDKSTRLTVSLQFDMVGANMVSGTVGNGAWTVGLNAYRTSKTGAGVGKYTLLIPGSDDSVSQPGGDGCGSLVVDATGCAKFRGTLADGTIISPSAGVSPQGLWPLFASLYSGNGLVIGWIGFTNEIDSDLRGQLFWAKQPKSGAYYSTGFSCQPEAIGSAYALNGGQMFNFSLGSVSFSQGNMPANFTNLISMVNNKVAGTNKSLSIKLAPATGLFSGSVSNPFGGKLKTLSFKGAVLQKQTIGCGFFLGTNQSGRVVLQAK